MSAPPSSCPPSDSASVKTQAAHPSVSFSSSVASLRQTQRSSLGLNTIKVPILYHCPFTSRHSFYRSASSSSSFHLSSSSLGLIFSVSPFVRLCLIPFFVRFSFHFPAPISSSAPRLPSFLPPLTARLRFSILSLRTSFFCYCISLLSPLEKNKITSLLLPSSLFSVPSLLSFRFLPLSYASIFSPASSFLLLTSFILRLLCPSRCGEAQRKRKPPHLSLFLLPTLILLSAILALILRLYIVTFVNFFHLSCCYFSFLQLLSAFADENTSEKRILSYSSSTPSCNSPPPHRTLSSLPSSAPRIFSVPSAALTSIPGYGGRTLPARLHAEFEGGEVMMQVSLSRMMAMIHKGMRAEIS